MNKDIVADILTIPDKTIYEAMCQVDRLDDLHASAEQPPTEPVLLERGTDQGVWTNGWSNSWTKSG